MLLTKQQCALCSAFLEPVGNETYRYIGENKATEHDKEMLLEFDEQSLLCSGSHAITNFDEIKTNK